MLKPLDKCKKCCNPCKCESESNAQLISCPVFLSKRSVKAQKQKTGIKIPPAKDHGLYEIRHAKSS